MVMRDQSANFRVLYIPHGGGPLPLLGHPGHQHLVTFLQNIAERLGRPEAIVVVSAHWEQSVPTITAGSSPSLIYDYSGFPPESYEIEYPASGAPLLAEKIWSLLSANGVQARLDRGWGFDHGVFVPLKLIYPDASIPCVQLSLIESLDPLAHIKIGQALKELKNENILFLGSGFSFHNMRKFGQTTQDMNNIEFDQWLIKTLTDPDLSTREVEELLVNWEEAPHARYCHPREEHLLPLHVCYGIAGKPAEVVFNNDILGKRATAFLW